MRHFDSSFLIDLLRERRRGEDGPAHRLLSTLPTDEEARVSVHAVCELYVGVELAQRREEERRRVEHLLSTLAIQVPDETFAPIYARLLVDLQARGATLATMDLLIATAALCEGAPLVTRNPRHFERVPGLEVITY